MGADMGQDQIGRYRRRLIKARLPELALDIIFFGETKAAIGLQSRIGGVPGRLRSQQFRHVGLRTAVAQRISTDRKPASVRAWTNSVG